jgi:SAM-dependent methyltransferase
MSDKIHEMAKFLTCPICHKKLELLDNSFICPQHHKYPIINGIPRILPDYNEFVNQKSFDFKWKHFADVVFRDDVMRSAKAWRLKRYGFYNEERFKDFLKDKEIILDAGCGLGRWTAWMAELNRKAKVFGVEITECINIGYKRYNDLDNVYFIQGDITKLPFPNDFFDFIFCEGVIHHTSNPYRTFVHLVSKLKKGGEIAIYVYKKKSPIREFCDDYIRERVSKMSVEEALEFAKAVTLFGKSLADLNVEIEVPVDIPILGIKKGKYNLQRFFYYNIFKCFWNEELGFDFSVAVNFDWYHPKYAYRFTVDEVKDWFYSLGMEITHIDVEDSGITIRGVK